jgi:hypothetical protein
MAAVDFSVLKQLDLAESHTSPTLLAIVHFTVLGILGLRSRETVERKKRNCGRRVGLVDVCYSVFDRNEVLQSQEGIPSEEP